MSAVFFIFQLIKSYFPFKGKEISIFSTQTRVSLVLFHTKRQQTSILEEILDFRYGLKKHTMQF
jgi:hypothetical protein